MECPYCSAEIGGYAHEHGTRCGHGWGQDIYWDEYICVCPDCNKEFLWYMNYVLTEDEVCRMEDHKESDRRE